MRLPLCRSAANSLAMQRAMTLLVFLALLAAAPFLQGALPTSPAPASCCAAMLKNDAPDDCDRQAPKSKPDRQCCANVRDRDGVCGPRRSRAAGASRRG